MAKRRRSESQSSYEGSESEPGSASGSESSASAPPTPAAPSASSVLTTLVRSAKAETNRGLKGKKAAKSTSSSRRKPKSKPARKIDDLDIKEHIGQIVVMPYGLSTRLTRRSKRQKLADILGPSQQPAHEDFPDMADVQTLEAVGLARINHSAGLVIHKNWIYPELDSFIRTQLPLFGKYIDSLPPRPNPDYEEGTSEPWKQYLPQYLLCTKDNRNVILAPNSTFPDGQKVSINVRDRQRRSFVNKFLVLCTYDEIDLSFFGPPSHNQGDTVNEAQPAAPPVTEFIQGSSSEPRTRAATGTLPKKKVKKYDSAFDDQLEEAWDAVTRK